MTDIVPLEIDPELVKPIDGLPEAWRDRANKFIALYAADPEVTMEDAARQIGMSYSGVYRWTQLNADFDARLHEISRIHSLQVIQRVVKTIVDAATKPQTVEWVEKFRTEDDGSETRIRTKTDPPNLRAAMFLIERHEKRFGESEETKQFAFIVGVERQPSKGELAAGELIGEDE